MVKSLRSSLFLIALLLIPVSPRADASAGRVQRAEPPPKEEKAAPESAAATPEAKKPTHASQVVVLAYHRFVDNVRHPDTEITLKEFEEQMQQLKDAGITPISMDDFLAWKRGEREIPERAALITFDDGWRSQYTQAWPVLKKYGYPFTLFIYTDYVKGGPKAGGESMTWQELEQFRDAGVGIESHTVSHADLRGKRSQRGTPEYDAWLRNELEGSRKMLEQKLGIRVRALAVPYGYYNATVQEAAEKAGYEALFTVEGKRIDASTPSNAIGRYILQHQKPALFQAALKAVGGPGGEAPPAVAELTAIALSPSPDSTTKEARPAIRANLRPFGKITPDSLTMRISGLGLVQATYDATANTATHQPKADLPPGRYTVIVQATADGQRKEGRWEFTVAPHAPPPAAEKAVEDGTAPKKDEQTLDGDLP